jgi:pSer/pThr/pTyr-binding forkhead associated (FHA) protein/tRNA A-37 threonylcarbamoyl transferase component Bud32
MAGEQLRVTEGKEQGKALKVDRDLHIGRAASDGDGRLGDDPLLSRRHARLSRTEMGQLAIEDLGSANGTFVNDERIDGVRTLELGDLVRMGETVLQVTDASGGLPQPTRLEAVPAAGVAAETDDQLLVTDGMAKGRRLTVADELMVGRAMGENGRLGDDPNLSRRHARVARGPDGRLAIEDLGSANGTFVNGERVGERRSLVTGDSISVGTTTLEVVGSERAAERPSPATRPTAPVSEPTGPEPTPASPAESRPTEPEPAPASPPASQPTDPEPTPPAPRAPAPRPRSPAPAQPPPPSSPPPRAPARPPRAPAARAGAASPAPGAAAGRREGADLTLGTVFAGCRVEEVIGQGDMGVVYRAEELALQREVALKLIRPDQSAEQRMRERFRRESQVAASVDHPNVIPIFEAGEEDGVLFITMRLVVGTDLRALISSEGRVDAHRTARIVRDVGTALDAAHKRGLVHRDVKPANVLLGRSDHVYLSDFGLAKPATAAGGLTRQGSIVARAEYVAPEQVTEDSVDARTDVYALGCLLFEALTGAAPFADKGGGAVMAHVEAPPPSAVALVPGLPRQFDDVVSRAMAKDPDERYPSAGDLGEAVLVAAGELGEAAAESIVATGEAAPGGARRSPQQARGAPTPSDAEGEGPAGDGEPAGGDAIRWGVAVAALIVIAVLMFVALGAISRL